MTRRSRGTMVRSTWALRVSCASESLCYSVSPMPSTTLLHATRLCAASGVLLVCVPTASAQSTAGPSPDKPDFADSEWTHYGGDAGGMRYSAASQINRTKIGQLTVVWTYRTGALEVQTDMARKAAFELTPILSRANCC